MKGLVLFCLLAIGFIGYFQPPDAVAQDKVEMVYEQPVAFEAPVRCALPTTDVVGYDVRHSGITENDLYLPTQSAYLEGAFLSCSNSGTESYKYRHVNAKKGVDWKLNDDQPGNQDSRT